jgi:hypothetical protein
MSNLNYQRHTPHSDIEDFIFENLYDAFNKIHRIKKKGKIAERKAIALDKKITRLEHQTQRCVSNDNLLMIHH